MLSGEQQTHSPKEHPLVATAKDILCSAGIHSDVLTDIRRYAVSASSRYCALTLNNYESYVVDVELKRYAHYPKAGISGFSEDSLLLSPDEERFSLEPSGHDSFEVDLQSNSVDWLCAKD
jgi:hypothetical protein